LRRLSTGNQIARRRGNFGYRLVNKSPLNAGSAHRGRPIKPANLLDRVRKTRSTNLRHTPAADEIPIASDVPPRPTSRGFLPWRFSDAGPGVRGAVVMGRHPKTFTSTDVRGATKEQSFNQFVGTRE